jgi:hypothetical protein
VIKRGRISMEDDYRVNSQGIEDGERGIRSEHRVISQGMITR